MGVGSMDDAQKANARDLIITQVSCPGMGLNSSSRSH